MLKSPKAQREQTSVVRQIDPEELTSLHGATRVVDVREPFEWSDELGHLDDAELAPLATISEAQRAWDKQSPVVVVCRSGRRSQVAAQQLLALGFEHVLNLQGGMVAYRAWQKRSP